MLKKIILFYFKKVAILIKSCDNELFYFMCTRHNSQTQSGLGTNPHTRKIERWRMIN